MSEIYNDIVKKYYDDILHYCNVRLNKDIYAARDCTQEVFLILAKKQDQLNLSANIKSWLYQVADREIKSYIRKHPVTVNIDELEEQTDESTNIEAVSILDELTPEERRLIEEYYSGEDKLLIAENHGITLLALYSRIRNIKKKLKEKLGV